VSSERSSGNDPGMPAVWSWKTSWIPMRTRRSAPVTDGKDGGHPVGVILSGEQLNEGD
jgi:hypothetical protein